MPGPRQPVVDLISELLMRGKHQGLPMEPSPGLAEYLNPTQNLDGRDNVTNIPGREFPFAGPSRPTTRNSFSDPMSDADPEFKAKLEDFISKHTPSPTSPSANEMLGASTSPLFIWVHNPQGSKARLEGPFQTSEEAYKTLTQILKENPDTYERGIKFTISPDSPE